MSESTTRCRRFGGKFSLMRVSVSLQREQFRGVSCPPRQAFNSFSLKILVDENDIFSTCACFLISFMGGGGGKVSLQHVMTKIFTSSPTNVFCFSSVNLLVSFILLIFLLFYHLELFFLFHEVRYMLKIQNCFISFSNSGSCVTSRHLKRGENSFSMISSMSISTISIATKIELVYKIVRHFVC